MAREYTLASAGGTDFVRPMERLMQMVHERWNHVVHTDAWSIRNGEQPYYTQGGEEPWPNDQGWPVLTAELKRCNPLWRSNMAGWPRGLRRWDAYEDWDKGTPFGIQHDLRLNYLSDLVHAVRKRYVRELSPEGCEDFTYIDHGAVPKLVANPSNLDIKLSNELQLTTVNHTSGGGATVVLSTTSHRIAMPIAGQGLLSMVTVVASVVASTPPTAPAWNAHVPSETISPGWSADSWRTPVRLRVCENNNGVPGDVRATSVMFSVSGLLGPRFYLHRPLALDHRLSYWLVIDMPLGISGQSCTLHLSSIAHEDTAYQLKTWNGITWVNHASPAIQFTLHMPKFMWRAKQLWIRTDEYQQQVHFRGLLHASRWINEHGACHFQFGPPADNARAVAGLAMAKQKSLLAGSGNFVYPSIEDTWGEGSRARTLTTTNYSDSNEDYFNSGWWNFGWTKTVPSIYFQGGPPQAFFGLEGSSGMGQPGVGLFYLDVAIDANRRLVRERKLLAWRAASNFTAARFEYRVGIAAITSFGIAGATSYLNVGDEFDFTGGLPAGQRARFRVTAVNNSPGFPGLPTELELINPGSYLKLSTPQSGSITDCVAGGVTLFLFLTTKVVEVVVVDGGAGYESDCPVVLEAPVNGIGTFTHAKVRGRVNNGTVYQADILEEGAGYGDGGRAFSMEQLKSSGASSDPAENTIWPGVRYFVRGTGIPVGLYANSNPAATGYEMVGDHHHLAAAITYNGQVYHPGESFVGVSGVPSFTLGGGVAYVVSAGIEGWAHFCFGCPLGSKRTPWTGQWSFLMRSTHGNPIDAFYGPMVVRKDGPGITLPYSVDFKTVGALVNGDDFVLPFELGLNLGWQVPVWGQAMWGIQDAAIFARVQWDINLDGASEGGGGSGDLPGTPVPQGTGLISIDTDNAGYRPDCEGEAVITVEGQGEGHHLIHFDGEGEAEIDVDADGEADASAAEIAEIDVDAEGEASQIVAQEGEGEGAIEIEGEGEADASPEETAEIDVDAEGEASQAVIQDGEGEGVIEVDGEGESELITTPGGKPDVWWSMNESSGVRLDSDSDFDLTPTGDVTSEAGMVGNAVNIGDGGFLVRNSSQSRPDHVGDFSWFGWGKLNANPGSGYTLLLMANDAGTEVFELSVSASGISASIMNSWGADGPVQTVGDWFFWTVTYDYANNTLKLYLDGTLVDTQTGGVQPSGTFDGGAGLGGGGLFGPNGSEGFSCDEVGRFPMVLALSEVRWLYNAGAGRSRDELPVMTLNPSAYWKLDETSGNRADSAGTNHLSEGGGTAPTYGTGKIGNCARSYSTTGFSFLSCPDNVLLRPATPISVAGWVKAEYMGPNPQAVFEIAETNGGFDYNGVNSRWGVAIEDSTLKFWVTNLDGTTHDMATRDLSSVGTGVWFFFAAVIRDGDLCLSINGGTEDVVTLNSANISAPVAKDFVVGCLSGPGYTLEIDELGVFDLALSAGDIAELYNDGNGRTYNP